MRAILALLALTGCFEGSGAPCRADADPAIEVVPAGEAFESFEDGDLFIVGNPPQGGAPYTPLNIRLRGLENPRDGVTVTVTGHDPEDDSEYGMVETWMRPMCSNIGPSAGMWVGAEVHYRYPEWDLWELPGRALALSVTVEDVRGNEVQTSVWGILEMW